MPGGGQTQAVTQNKDPWGPAQPYITDIMARGGQLYNSGAGSQTWGGPLQAAQSPQTQMGINAITGTANAQRGMAGQPYTYGQQQIQNNGLTSGYGAPMGTFGNVASGQNGITTGGAFGNLAAQSQSQNAGANGVLNNLATNPAITNANAYGDLAQRAGGPTSSATNLGGMASGADAGQNPYLMKMIQDNANIIGNRVSSSMSGAGRYGSAGHEDALARSITAANAPILSAAYEGDRNRMLSASGQIDASNNAARGMQLGALQGQSGAQAQNAGINLNAASTLGSSNRADTGLGIQALQGQTGVQGQNIANQLSGAQGQTGILNTGQNNAAQWASMMPQLQQAAYAPGNQLMAVGDYQNQYAQQGIDAQRQLFDQQQQMPWTQLNRYNGTVNGLGGLIGNAGTTTGNVQTQQQMPWTQMAGLGIAGLGLLSDRNEKTDIKKIGDDDATGLPVYSYRYRDDPKSYPKVVGPMAQDIEAAMPGSTERMNGKLYIKPEATAALGILAMLNKKKAA